jgi:hypothetical protein
MRFQFAFPSSFSIIGVPILPRLRISDHETLPPTPGWDTYVRDLSQDVPVNVRPLHHGHLFSKSIGQHRVPGVPHWPQAWTRAASDPTAGFHFIELG